MEAGENLCVRIGLCVFQNAFLSLVSFDFFPASMTEHVPDNSTNTCKASGIAVDKEQRTPGCRDMGLGDGRVACNVSLTQFHAAFCCAQCAPPPPQYRLQTFLFRGEAVSHC